MQKATATIPLEPQSFNMTTTCRGPKPNSVAEQKVAIPNQIQRPCQSYSRAKKLQVLNVLQGQVPTEVESNTRGLIKGCFVLIMGRGGVGFHFVTRSLLRPGVNCWPLLPAWMTRGPGRTMGRGRYFTFSANCLDGPCLLIRHSCPCAGSTYLYE